MKVCVLFAVILSVAQAATQVFTNTPLSHFQRYNPVSSGQRYPGYFSGRYGLTGRPEYLETVHQESGNYYGGQRDGRFVSRDGRDNLRGYDYSERPSRGFSARPFNQQYNPQGSSRYYGADGYRYPQQQISFNSPLANTRSYNPRFDASGIRQNEFSHY
ncbi:uncharacterized protein LOC129226779 [Uloborus diversus]|uniref:uncharacterized protein LOC129226779 n=1 Tax=Uloborus diversus TaxID=327109 RepID=UPI00240A335E|nr:uncharacterized protein LOC129226779 [Uloborus diversus]